MDRYLLIEKDIFAYDWFDVGSLNKESAVSDDSSPNKELESVNIWLYIE
jgi:hypothetical protein